MNLRDELSEPIRAALNACGAHNADAIVKSASKPEFGDYQANGVMAAAKRLGENPRQLAEKLLQTLDLNAFASKVEIAGPGFINIHLDNEYLSACLNTDPNHELLTKTLKPKTVVVDYSSPNLAKEMHVGHMRSTIIGDAQARVLEALGHVVIRQNHVGDWGTQFGMLITYLEETGASSTELGDLENFYRQAKTRFDEDQDFAQRAREAVVALQQGDESMRAQWQTFINISLAHCQKIYDSLGIKLTRQDVMAESAYNSMLNPIVEHLDAADLLTESEGARCVFLEEFKGKDGALVPVIVVKSGGGFLYSTTDLAAVRHRADQLHADRVLYFVDARQAFHFRQIFAVARAAKLLPETMSLEHTPFGTMLGADGKPFQTRLGGVIKLEQFIEESVSRALALINSKNPDLDQDLKNTIASRVGIGAIKYADLSKNRTSDYVFDWDLMMSFEGNTAPYLQYAYTRVQSLIRRAHFDVSSLPPIAIVTDEEHQLAVALLRFQEVVEQVAVDAYLHHLCAYLYDLAGKFSRFYEHCPVLSEQIDVRSSRLALSSKVGDTLQFGLDLLGIETTDVM